MSEQKLTQEQIRAIFEIEVEEIHLQSFRDVSEMLLEFMEVCERWIPRMLSVHPVLQMTEVIMLYGTAKLTLDNRSRIQEWLERLERYLVLKGVSGPRLGCQHFSSWHALAVWFVPRIGVRLVAAVNSTVLKWLPFVAQEGEEIPSETELQEAHSKVAEFRNSIREIAPDAWTLETPPIIWQEMYTGLRRELILFEAAEANGVSDIPALSDLQTDLSRPPSMAITVSGGAATINSRIESEW